MVLYHTINTLRLNSLIALAVLLMLCSGVLAQDSLRISGQASAYTLLNTDSKIPWWNGARFIPQFNFADTIAAKKLFDLEASANIYGNAGFRPFDSSHFDGTIKPYRLWARYSTRQFELRAGLQKINFGSATILRPLMWFDQLDPRDPLKLTDGVWGLLSRYYFLNNTNIWLWGLYGNDKLKGWETLHTYKRTPEFGGRIQTPVPKGEAAFSYHHRVADGELWSDSINYFGKVPENRFGFDAKFDMAVGWWVEASWSHFKKNPVKSLNQEIINLGMDYTFGFGKGLTATYEHLLAASSEKAFSFRNAMTFSLLSASYPIDLLDNLSAILYYDWGHRKVYSFLNWQRQYNNFGLNIMGYLNPRHYNIPTQPSGGLLYAGKGIQVMFVYNF
jgi:hypothetical protein